jgi:hypothetical protein
MNETFDPTKPVQTRDGRAARVICTDKKSNQGFTIIALVEDSCDKRKEQVLSYQTCGSIRRDGTHTESDLVNVPERIQREYWLNLYEAFTHCTVHLSKANADSARSPKRIACIPVNIDVEVGTGLVPSDDCPF